MAPKRGTEDAPDLPHGWTAILGQNRHLGASLFKIVDRPPLRGGRILLPPALVPAKVLGGGGKYTRPLSGLGLGA